MLCIPRTDDPSLTLSSELPGARTAQSFQGPPHTSSSRCSLFMSRHTLCAPRAHRVNVISSTMQFQKIDPRARATRLALLEFHIWCASQVLKHMHQTMPTQPACKAADNDKQARKQASKQAGKQASDAHKDSSTKMNDSSNMLEGPQRCSPPTAMPRRATIIEAASTSLAIFVPF